MSAAATIMETAGFSRVEIENLGGPYLGDVVAPFGGRGKLHFVWGGGDRPTLCGLRRYQRRFGLDDLRRIDDCCRTCAKRFAYRERLSQGAEG